MLKTETPKIPIIMAVTTLNPMFQTSSGLLERPSKSNQHSHGKYLLTTHRKAETTSPDCQRAYSYGKGDRKRSTPVTRDELAKRERFAEVSRAVQARRTNLSTLTTDQQAYLAQKDLPNGKKTFVKYLWSLELAAYDAQHS